MNFSNTDIYATVGISLKEKKGFAVMANPFFSNRCMERFFHFLIVHIIFCT